MQGADEFTDGPVPRDALRIPHIEPGMSVALFGGSFNPPHAGHLHVSEIALQRGRFDQVWWIVTPGNPLKDHDELQPLAIRIAKAEELVSDRRIKITAFEATLDTAYTERTLSYLVNRFPSVRFVWLMGADNLAGFHRWQNWRRIAAMMPIMVVDRPGATLSYRSAKAAIALSRYRIDESDASLLAYKKAPAWTFVHGPRSSLSSTAIRRAGRSGGTI